MKIIQNKFNENVSPKNLADNIRQIILESKKLTDTGLKQLIAEHDRIADDIETGTYKTVEMVHVVTSLSKKKTAFYSESGHLLQVVPIVAEDITLFSQD